MRAVEQHDMRIECATMQQLLGLLLMILGTLRTARYAPEVSNTSGTANQGDL